MIKEKGYQRKHIYHCKQENWKYYMVEISYNSKDEITKIKQFVSNDLQNWKLLDKYTYPLLKLRGYPTLKLEMLYKYMYNNRLSKLDIYDIIEDKKSS